MPSQKASKNSNSSNALEKKLKRMRLHHKIIFSILGTVGVVGFWRGMWAVFDLTPGLNHPVASLLVGVALLVISGFIYKLS